MLKKTIKYTNPFTDEEVSEEHYFHISKADLVQMEMEEHGDRYKKDGQELTGMQAKLQRIVDSQDGRAIMQEIRDIIRRSYGKKDGDRFIKSPVVWENFASTEAYSQLIFDLCTDAGAAAEFMNGIIPNNLEQVAAEVRAIAEKEEVEEPTPVPASAENGGAEAQPPVPETKVEPRVLTAGEISDMDAEELKAGLADGRYKLS